MLACLQFRDGGVAFPSLDIDPPLHKRREEESRIEISRPIGQLHRCLVFAIPSKCQYTVEQDRGDKGSSSVARLPSANDSSKPVPATQAHTEQIMGERVVRIKYERAMKFALRARPIEFIGIFEIRKPTCALRLNHRPIERPLNAASLAFGIASTPMT